MPSRPTRWVDTVITRDIPDSTQQAQSLMGDLSDSEKRTATVIRIILSMGVWSTTLAGAYGVQRAGFGIGVASEEAFNANVFPDPLSAAEKPTRGWLWRTIKHVSQNGTGTTIVVPVDADLRAARKLENGVLYMLMEASNRQGTTFTTSWEGIARVLVKL